MADKCIISNPDIAGIGIRINFYTTILVAILTRENKYTEDELLCGMYKNGVVNGLAILFTAVIQTIQGKLDLYHAMVVMYILFFFNIVFLFGQRKFVWDWQWGGRDNQKKFEIFLYLLMHAFGVFVFFIWFLYAAVNGNKFGSQPPCNHLVIFVLFFFDVRATVTWFRIMMILFFSSAIPFLLLFLIFLILARARWTRAITDSVGDLFKNHPKLGRARYVIGIPLAVYIIANLELIVNHNRSNIRPGENEWGFGQIIAVVLTLGMFIDIAAAIRKWRTPKAQTRPEASKAEAQ